MSRKWGGVTTPSATSRVSPVEDDSTECLSAVSASVSSATVTSNASNCSLGLKFSPQSQDEDEFSSDQTQQKPQVIRQPSLQELIEAELTARLAPLQPDSLEGLLDLECHQHTRTIVNDSHVTNTCTTLLDSLETTQQQPFSLDSLADVESGVDLTSPHNHPSGGNSPLQPNAPECTSESSNNCFDLSAVHVNHLPNSQIETEPSPLLVISAPSVDQNEENSSSEVPADGEILPKGSLLEVQACDSFVPLNENEAYSSVLDPSAIDITPKESVLDAQTFTPLVPSPDQRDHTLLIDPLNIDHSLDGFVSDAQVVNNQEENVSLVDLREPSLQEKIHKEISSFLNMDVPAKIGDTVNEAHVQAHLPVMSYSSSVTQDTDHSVDSVELTTESKIDSDENCTTVENCPELVDPQENPEVVMLQDPEQCNNSDVLQCENQIITNIDQTSGASIQEQPEPRLESDDIDLDDAVEEIHNHDTDEKNAQSAELSNKDKSPETVHEMETHADDSNKEEIRKKELCLQETVVESVVQEICELVVTTRHEDVIEVTETQLTIKEEENDQNMCSNGNLELEISENNQSNETQDKTTTLEASVDNVVSQQALSPVIQTEELESKIEVAQPVLPVNETAKETDTKAENSEIDIVDQNAEVIDTIIDQNDEVIDTIIDQNGEVIDTIIDQNGEVIDTKQELSDTSEADVAQADSNSNVPYVNGTNSDNHNLESFNVAMKSDPQPTPKPSIATNGVIDVANTKENSELDDVNVPKTSSLHIVHVTNVRKPVSTPKPPVEEELWPEEKSSKAPAAKEPVDEFEKMEQEVILEMEKEKEAKRKKGEGEKKKKKKKKKGDNEKENKISSSQSKDELYEKHVGPRIRSFDPAKMKSKFSKPKEPTQVSSECRICGKQVFQMEKIVAEKASWHKNCFRCKECNKNLTLETYQSHEGALYCKPHFKELFKPKAVIQDAEQERKDRQMRRPRMIVLESQPEALPDDVVRATAKPDYGLEELNQTLNVKERFNIFENLNKESDQPRAEPVAVRRSHSLMSKAAARFFDGENGSFDSDEAEEREGSEDEEEEEEEEEEEGEENRIVKGNRKKKERPMSFSGMGDLKAAWEQKQRREEMTQSRKEEIARFRQMLCAGKNLTLKERFEKGELLERDSDDEDGVGGKKKEEIKIEGKRAASNLKKIFEQGQPFILEDEEEDEVGEENGVEDDEDGEERPVRRPKKVRSKIVSEKQEVEEIFKEAETAKKARNVFRHIDSKVAQEEGNPLLRSQSFANANRENRRSLDSMQGEDDLLGRDPNLIKCTDNYQDEVDCRNTKNILQMFRKLEMGNEDEDDEEGPRPLKRFTPPPGSEEYDEESDEEYSDEEYSDEDDEEEEEEDEGVKRERVRDEILQMLSARKAAQLRAKFEKWESNQNGTEKEKEDLEEIMPSLDTAKNLKAMFEQKVIEVVKPVASKPITQKVNRFVGGGDKCVSCNKTVYAMEKLELHSKILHKSCFKCHKCNTRLSMGSFSFGGGDHMYCTTHYKQLFTEKGSYDALTQEKGKWTKKIEAMNGDALKSQD